MLKNNLITPMHFTMVRDAICQLLANEREQQKKLAKAAGKNEKEIEQDFDFTIFPKRFRIPDVSEMPCVFVYFDRLDFPEEHQSINENYAHGNLQIDYYCVGKSGSYTDENGQTIQVPADSNAEDRLNYLTAQIYKILFSEKNFSKGTDQLVTHVKLNNWRRLLEPDELNQAATVLGGSFSVELGFNEPAYYTDGRLIKEFYFKLNIQDEFIDPFCRIYIDT
ncbi:hypothetical protein IJX73_02915 [bacterium]|nr:hypothetical protein [bacterium]